MVSIERIKAMNEKRPRIECGRCGGCGTVPLGVKEYETLVLLRAQTELLNGVGMSRLAKCSNMAMCNRLAKLEKLGLAKSVRYGRERLWQAV